MERYSPAYDVMRADGFAELALQVDPTATGELAV
jgi:hypothetical protein